MEGHEVESEFMEVFQEEAKHAVVRARHSLRNVGKPQTLILKRRERKASQQNFPIDDEMKQETVDQRSNIFFTNSQKKAYKNRLMVFTLSGMLEEGIMLRARSMSP